MNKRKIPVHPGRIIKDELDAINMTSNNLAVQLQVPASRIDRIVKCKRRVSPDTAIRLAHFFGGSPKFWLNLQTNHDLVLVDNQNGDEVRATIRPMILDEACL